MLLTEAATCNRISSRTDTKSTMFRVLVKGSASVSDDDVEEGARLTERFLDLKAEFVTLARLLGKECSITVDGVTYTISARLRMVFTFLEHAEEDLVKFKIAHPNITYTKGFMM